MPAHITDPEQLKEPSAPFTPEQTACIVAPPAPQVIVAGAGSGKTTVMAARVVWLVGTGQVAPEQVLGLTFTNKAAGELAERVRKALIRAGVTDPDVIDPDHPPGEPAISTYHAFAGRLLTDHGLRLGLEPTSRLLADATRYQLAARVLREAPGPYPALTRSFADLVSDLLALDAELAEHLVRPEELRTWDAGLLDTLEGVRLSNAELRKVPEAAAARRELADLVIRYRAAKRERDLLTSATRSPCPPSSPESPRWAACCATTYRVVLLDEYQDTSVAQRILLAGLFGGGTGHPVTAVGGSLSGDLRLGGASAAWDTSTTDRPVTPQLSPTVPHQAAPPEQPPGAAPAPAFPAHVPARLTPEEARTIASWDRDLDALTGELLRARESVTEVHLPASLTASQLLSLAADPDGFAQELARPMPRPPQPAARRGTRFHAWVEARFEPLTLPLLEPEELPGGDAEIADEQDLEFLKDAFERTEYARRTPFRVEAPFQLSLAGRVVRGRIDAVYKQGDGDTATYEIVDWKTNRAATADPLQLALYRIAWAEQQHVPPASVTAAFLYVRTGEVVRPRGLPDRAALEKLLLAEPVGDEPHDRGVRAGR
ncbi:ATP-dependent helicase/nuclease subunit A [Streptomyces tendae]